MEIKLRIVNLLPVMSYVSKRDGQPANKYAFVGETLDAQYPKKICFDVFGDDKWMQMQLMVGNVYNISFDLQSREWNGKWFTNATAFAASVDAPQQQVLQSQQRFMPQPPYSQPMQQQYNQQPQQSFQPAPVPMQGGNSNVPF